MERKDSTMIIDVVKLTQDLIKEARTGNVPISTSQIVLQQGGKGGNWFLCDRITRVEAKKLLFEKFHGILNKESVEDLTKLMRSLGAPITLGRVVFQPKGRGNAWFLGTLISRRDAMELLKKRAREIKENLKAKTGA